MVTFLTPLAKNSLMPKGSIDRAFAVSMFTEHRDQASICSFALRVVSVRTELALGHLRYYFRDVPPQSNSPPGSVPDLDRALIMMLPLQHRRALTLLPPRDDAVRTRQRFVTLGTRILYGTVNRTPLAQGS